MAGACRIIFLLLTLLVVNISGNAQRCEHCFEIQIFQKGKNIPILSHKVQLEKDTFEIHILMNRPQGIAINACPLDSNIRNVKNGKELNDMTPFLYGMAEALQNPENNLLITCEYPSYWYYDSATEHRFNQVVIEGNRLRCIRKIHQWTEVDNGNIILPRQYPNQLHLGFIACEWVATEQKEREYLRDYLTIVFK
jgi:hypothetical protein